MADEPGLGSSAYRLATPRPELYAPSANEQTILRGITPETIGAMYGLFNLERQRTQNNAADYSTQLERVNQGQQGIINQRLDMERLKNLRDFQGTMMQHGGQPASNMRGVLDGPDASLNSRELTAGADAIRLGNTEADTINKLMSGAHQGSEAGINLNPGQSTGLNAEAIRRLAATTGDPRSIREARIQAAGHAANGTNAPRTQVEIDPITNLPKITSTVRGMPVEQLPGMISSLQNVQRGANNGARIRGSDPVTPPVAGGTPRAGAPPTGRGTTTGSAPSEAERASALAEGRARFGNRPFQTEYNARTGQWTATPR